MLKVFIACPYTQSDKSICHEQFEVATQLASNVIASNAAAFSPVTHGHPIILQHSDSSISWKKLRKQSLSFHNWADALLVVDLPSASECAVIQEDIALFREAEKPVRFIDPSHIQNQLETLLKEFKQSKSSRL